MNITIIVPFLPYPLNSGGAQAVFNMIDKIRSTDNITLVCIQSRLIKQRYVAELKEKWPNVNIVMYSYTKQLADLKFLKDKAIRALNLLYRKNDKRFVVERALRPYGVHFDNNLKHFINKTLQSSKPDVIQVEFFPLLHIIDLLPQNIKHIFVHHELRFVRNERLLRNIELTDDEKKYGHMIKCDEIAYLNRYDRVVTLTDTDKRILQEHGVTTEIKVSPAAISTPIKPYCKWQNKLLFLGGYSHKPNVEGLEWFVEKVAPKIEWAEFPNVEFHLVGGGWPDKIVEKYQNDLKIPFIYEGFVPKLEDAATGSIMIVPILTGSGMRMKILEAAALSIPFITTSVGVEGLDFTDKDSCIVEDEADKWVTSLSELMTDETLRHKLSDKAQRIFKEKYSVEALANKRMQVYKFQ